MTVDFVDAHKILGITQFCVPYVPPTSDFVGLERVLMVIMSTSPFPVGWICRKETITVIRAPRVEWRWHCRPRLIPAVIITSLLTRGSHYNRDGQSRHHKAVRSHSRPG
jgi:hypothetical protein